MLGHLDAVKAYIAASPGIQKIKGPHSITLLRHAIAGGAAAQAVTDYLKTLPGADRRPATQPLSADAIRVLLERALRDGERGLGQLGLEVDPEALGLMADEADGDSPRQGTAQCSGVTSDKRNRARLDGYDR